MTGRRYLLCRAGAYCNAGASLHAGLSSMHQGFTMLAAVEHNPEPISAVQALVPDAVRAVRFRAKAALAVFLVVGVVA
jgi:hypothetical protein